METEYIHVRGAREHNLRGVNVDIPKRRLVVFTGVSGSGKSSLAFDTIYAEGQRRYVESLSAYARQFLGQVEKPRVEAIRGLSPTISIEQRTAGRNPRSTVATITEVADYLRVLYARAGTPHCPTCGREVKGASAEQIVRELAHLPAGTRIDLLAPLVEARKGEHRDALDEARAQGLVRVRVDGVTRDLSEDIRLDKKRKHAIEAVVDRLIVKEDITTRLTDSVETALRLGKGSLVVAQEGRPDRRYSERLACTTCGIGLPEMTPQRFSFNHPLGMCTTCNGLGRRMEFDLRKVLVDPTRSLREGALKPWASGLARGEGWTYEYASQILQALDIDPGVRFDHLPPDKQQLLLHGAEGRRIKVVWKGANHQWHSVMPWRGLLGDLQHSWETTQSERVRRRLTAYLTESPCPSCDATRLAPEPRAVRFVGKTLPEISGLTIEEATTFFQDLHLTGERAAVAQDVLKEILWRLRFLRDVGLSYLTLDRPGPSLSGGEAQRIRLASQMGSELTGVVYVLDEPSIGLHQRDNERLLAILEHLRDVGNTVIVVEHDADTVRRADHVVDFGPGAGRAGGEIVYSGPPAGMGDCERSLTGAYLSGRSGVAAPRERRRPSGHIVVRAAAAHNLRDIDATFPLGVFTCVTGVSGAGKSTLVNGILYPALAAALLGSEKPVGRHRCIEGIDALDKVIAIDQRPIGRTPRSNPATYTKVFDPIRELYTQMRDARAAGYGPGRFSFNVKGGRCEACRGDGVKRIEMHFLADVFVTCEACGGRRFNEATLKVRYRGLSIADVLDLTVAEALDLFAAHPPIARILRTLADVGMDYVHLGQPATTLSGGEAQRVKLARELARAATGRTLYVLDEPSTGLHFDDVRKLLAVLARLVDAGNTVVVIEHNLEIVKSADWVIDLGPEGGDAGGELVAEGTPEEVARIARSYTGRFLAPLLGLETPSDRTTGRRTRRPARKRVTRGKTRRA